MKKLKLSALVLGLSVLFGGTAFAAQASYTDTTAGKTYYAPTPKQFTADTPENKTNYPYEIYLPNESAPQNYRIHSNYTKNTDACASCHATHTAVGPSLLQWYSVYETCMACHDGTVTTTYNVEDGVIGTSGDPTFGGHFGSGQEPDLSSHNVQGAVEIAAAPGGSVVSETVDVGSGKTTNVWGTTFGCESCHTPHGQGGNARILHPDPNGWASYTKKGDYNVSSSQAVYAGNVDTNFVTLIKGYPYQVTFKAADGSTVTDVYLDNTAGYSVIGGANKSLVTIVTGTASIEVEMGIGDYLGTNETVQHKKGINTFCGACHVDYNTEDAVAVNGATNIMGNKENRPGYGKLTGRYSQAHRHAVGIAWNYGGSASDKYIGQDKLMMTMGTDTQVISCLTCHFAHGTSQDYWKKWTKKFDTDIATDKWDNDLHAADADKLTVDEIAGSSALKRLPNMATCEACHQKGDAAEGYLANTAQEYNQAVNTENGIFTVEGATTIDETAQPCTTSGCHPVAGKDRSDAMYKQTTHTNCQICHGGASKHVQAPSSLNIINPAKLTFAQQTQLCSGCHNTVANNFAASAHYTSGKATCVTCHESHIIGETLKTGEQNSLCVTCHTNNMSAVQAVGLDNHKFGGTTVGMLDPLKTNFDMTAFLATSRINAVTTKVPTAAGAAHENLAATVGETTCWGGGNGCHAADGKDMYSDFVGTIHFAETGKTDPNTLPSGADANEVVGMRNRY